jgi:UDP-N-acetylmuramyl tripeptide synthase
MRKRGSHGAALPGLIAEKLNPSLLNKLTNLPEGIIVVSGTNGKTTTTHLLASILTAMGKRVFTNHSGSNMTRGLLASIVRYASWKGDLGYDVAVLEIDEAYAAKLAPVLKPRASLLTNVLRDQLDRFGEIDHTARLLGELASHTGKVVVYNVRDRRLQMLHDSKSDTRYVRVGFSDTIASHFPDDDALYDAASITKSPVADYWLKDAAHGQISVSGAVNLSVKSDNLQGWHNALNFTFATAMVTELYGKQPQSVYESLHPPYGRGEEVIVDGKPFILQLVKNPAGFRIAMDVATDRPALIVINDHIADGRDVSWLWDVDVSSLSSRPSVSTAGTRGYDMANRLKYADSETLHVEPDPKLAIQKFVSENRSGVLFLTYTAMLESRKILKGLSS